MHPPISFGFEMKGGDLGWGYKATAEMSNFFDCGCHCHHHHCWQCNGYVSQRVINKHAGCRESSWLMNHKQRNSFTTATAAIDDRILPYNQWLAFSFYQKSLAFRLDSGSSWLDGVNGILMQQEPNSPKQDYWNWRAIASLANTLLTVVEPVPKPLLSCMLLLHL
jgi:hypothetical protein